LSMCKCLVEHCADIVRYRDITGHVRRASVLPATSFRFSLTTDTLAVQLMVPAVGPIEDFHLQVGVPGRAHHKNRALE
jgi:hypothetical protein